MKKNILEMKNIIKEFPGVKALDNVNFQIKEGEIHCLVGENGAGKSTLMKVLSGFYPYGSYEGDIIYKGKKQHFMSIKSSEVVGIAIIYQELALVKEMSIYENIFLGHEITKNGIIDWNETIISAQRELKKVGIKESPDTKVKELSVGKQQLVEIAKALSKKAKLLILDEPTAALNEDDSDNLLKLLLKLKKEEGLTSVMISHKLNEIKAIADKITVLRDGQTICTLDCHEKEVTESEIVRYMVGRELSSYYPPRDVPIGDNMMEVKNWNVFDSQDSTKKVINDISFHVKKGEIIGIAGLMGAGRTELCLSIFGKTFGSNISGELILNGMSCDFNSPRDAILNRLCYLTEDRKEKGLILIQDIKQNISLPNLKKLSHMGIVDKNSEINKAERYKKSLKIKAFSIEQILGNLSGGNQQKVVLSKWLLAHPDVLIVDEPTRGIDVGAKHEIYTIMNNLVSKGKSIIMVSSELPEVLGMSDRVYVMCDGKFTGIFDNKNLTQEEVMYYATGQKKMDNIN